MIAVGTDRPMPATIIIFTCELPLSEAADPKKTFSDFFNVLGRFHDNDNVKKTNVKMEGLEHSLTHTSQKNPRSPVSSRNAVIKGGKQDENKTGLQNSRRPERAR